MVPSNPIVSLTDVEGTRDWHSEKETAESAVFDASQQGSSQVPAAGVPSRPRDEGTQPFFVWKSSNVGEEIHRDDAASVSGGNILLFPY